MAQRAINNQTQAVLIFFDQASSPSIGTMSKDFADSAGESRWPICSSPSSIAIITTGLAWFTP
jgi:hypothetical protein